MFTRQCSFPSLLRGPLGGNEGKGIGKEKGKEGEGRRKIQEERRGENRSKRGREGREVKGRKRLRETDREERRGTSQIHGIQKQQLSKALAGMQVCRSSGPRIPWHTKLA